MSIQIEKWRTEYGNTPLEERSLNKDPLKQLERWLKEAKKAHVFEPNGMTLSTCSPTGRLSSRMVLCKGLEKGRVVFFSNCQSRKGEHLANNPRVALCFWFKEIYRQVTLEGEAHLLSVAKSAAYFAKRPKGAQIAAHVSNQSAPLASREVLEEAFANYKKDHRGTALTRPPSFRGYAVVPDRVEFWQGRKNRLHDRFCYVNTNGSWLISRLAP